VQELFFLGRLFWLIELAEKERGWSFDKIIVDMPAMGHAVSLFNIAPTIAKFGITGPLAVECARVSKMLADEKSTGTVIVTLPEDLPVEETIEFYPKICHELSRSPDAIFINRSLSRHQQLQKSAWQEIEEKKWFLQLKENLSSQNRAQFEIILKELLQRYKYQDIIKEWSENLPDKFQTSLNFIPDFTLSEFNLESAMTVQKMCLYFEKHFLQ
jgi:anion-transporting  ArsA/GET3 family ATPase